MANSPPEPDGGAVAGLPAVRRIVTATNPEGRSYIAEDGPAPHVITVEERPGYRNTNLWRVLGRIDEPDTTADQRGVLPPNGGVVVRTVDFPPMAASEEERKRGAAAVFSKMFPDASHDADSKRSPGMHTTDTVDFAVLLEGEVVAVLDDDETVMRAGDVLIQRGTSHAWENRTQKMARMLFVLCDAER
ncbi:MAG: cupin domain-containing protein [Maricaulaceae bacterium]|jgi:hypothetical protein